MPMMTPPSDLPTAPVKKEQAGLAQGLLLAGALGILLLLGGFAFLAEDVMTLETIRLDNAVLTMLQQSSAPPLTSLAYFASAMGADGVSVLMALTLFVLLVRRHWLLMVELMLVTFGAQLLNDVLKGMFQRTRPAPVAATILFPSQAFSFPSG